MPLETPQLQMANRLAGGRLAEIIAQHRTDGASFDHIVRLLYAEYGIVTTRQTLVGWFGVLNANQATDEAMSDGSAA